MAGPCCGKNMNNKINTCVLLSGGIDSAACLHFYLKQRRTVNALYIDYGQLSASYELKAAEQISQYYGTNLKVLKLEGVLTSKKDYICGRNLFLLGVALMEMPNANIIALGIHAGTSYSDCDVLFIEKMQSVFDIYAKGTVQLGVPFLGWSKNEVWQYCKQQKVPLDLTYSCEYGKKQPCGKCLSCKDLEALNASKM